MKKTKKALASLAIAGMVLSMAPMSVFAADATTRLSGAGRVETAIAVATNGWAAGSDNVIVVSADDANIVDALAAAPLAGQLNAPILVTYKDALDAQVQQKIVDLKAKNVYAIGALSDATVASLKAIAGVTVEQLQGADRTETAAKVTAKLSKVNGSFVVAYDGKADALSAASFAAANSYSIVIANPDGTIPSNEAVVAPTYTVGGQVSVTGATALKGADRYATNAAVVDGLTFSYDKVYVANGESLVDALAGAPLAAMTKSPIVLADATQAVTAANDNLTSTSQVIALGGTGAVSDAVLGKVAYQAPATLAVESISAINGGQLLVKFNKEVDETTAIDPANYIIKKNGSATALVNDGTAYTAELQDGDSSVIITLATPIPNDETATFAIVVENVLEKDSLTDEVAVYTQTLTVSDKEDATVTEVTSKTNTNVADKVTIKFSEPVLVPTVKIDGSTKSASLSADGKTATVQNLSLDATTSHTLDIVNLTDFSGNVNENITKSFSVTKDTVAPTFTMSTVSDNKIVLTFDKTMDATTIDTASVLVKDEDLDTLSAGDYTVTEDMTSSHKKFNITLTTTDPYASKDKRSFTVMVKDTVKDSLGNKAVATSKVVSLTKDETEPTLQSITYTKNSAGEVTNVLFKYDEKVVVDTPAGLTAKNLVTGATVALFGTAYNAPTILSDGKTVKVDVASATAATVIKDGKLEIAVPASFVTDTAFTSNDNKAAKLVVDFGAGTASSLKVSSATVTATNQITVVFSDDVTYSSATNPANYTVNGVVLPSDATITFTDATHTVVTLPTGFVKKDDTGAVFRVQNVATEAGVKVSANQTVIVVDDNAGPVIVATKSAVNSNGSLSIGFDEKVAPIDATLTSALAVADLRLFINDVELTTSAKVKVVATNGAGADAGKYVLTFNSVKVSTAETGAGNDGTVTEFFDVDGDGLFSSNDVLVKKTTGLTNAQIAAYVTGTLDLNKVSSLSVGTVDSPVSIVDQNGTPNVIAEKQSVVIK